MMQQHTIHIAGGVVRNPLVRLTEPVTLDFLAGEHIAIVGPNGAGKSLLVDMLTEKYPLRDGELTYDFSPSLHIGLFHISMESLHLFQILQAHRYAHS